jgi:redox-sensitive bicupin YhaK (pirin superfamily)
MFVLHPSERRGRSSHGWLEARHSFSFAHHHDPDNMHFGPLVVINEDRIQPGTGFPQHGHRDMEIISYVLEGELAHRDSLGNGSVIRPGDVQRMSAGHGVQHSEFNRSVSGVTHFLQIWIEPEVRGLAPGYQQRHFSAQDKRGRLCLILSPDGRDGSVSVHQQASAWAGLFDGDESAAHEVAPGRRAYLHVARGALRVNGKLLGAGDALKAEVGARLALAHGLQAEVLLFDLPA